MKPQFVPVILGGRRGTTPFTPARLFTSGVTGAWYDPSDYSTLFQNSAGTTPVTAVEQPVGLMLDKSQGLVLGSELVTGSASAYTGNGTVSTVGDTVTATCTTNGTYGIRWASSNISNIWTRCTFEVVTNSASKSLNFYPNLAHAGISVGTTTGSKTYTVFAPTASGGNQIPVFFISGLAGESFSVRVVSIKEFPGNHASQATPTSCPVLRARYNLLTYSEQFDNAAWSKPNTTITANSVVAPDGTTTADLVTATNGADATCNQTVSGVNAAGVVLTFTFYARCASGTVTLPVLGDDGTGKFWSNPNTNKVTVTTAWQRFTVTGTAPALSASVARAGFGGFSSWTTGDAVYIWGADLRTGSSAGTYQRIAAATDYATAGFLPYLYFVTDDSFGTNSIDFTATDAMSVCVGVTKNSDAATAMIAELSADLGANNGAFSFYAPSGASPSYGFFSKGTVRATAEVNNSTYAAPQTSVLSGIADISTPTVALRFNGAQVVASSATQGTGNYGNYPLYIGRRNNASLPFNGNFYQLIVCGKTLSASELASTEAYVATKTGVVI